MANHREERQRYRASEAQFLVGVSIAATLSLLFAAISRDPMLIAGVSLLGIDAAANVGHIVVFGPIMLLGASAYLRWASIRLNEDWHSLPSLSRPLRLAKLRWLPVLLAPGLASFFLTVQLVGEFAPRDSQADPLAQCNRFDRWRMLHDVSLLHEDFVYCFSGIDQVQGHLPDIFPPVQPWLYLVLSAGTTWISYLAWFTWSGPGVSARNGRRRSEVGEASRKRPRKGELGIAARFRWRRHLGELHSPCERSREGSHYAPRG